MFLSVVFGSIIGPFCDTVSHKWFLFLVNQFLFSLMMEIRSISLAQLVEIRALCVRALCNTVPRDFDSCPREYSIPVHSYHPRALGLSKTALSASLTLLSSLLIRVSKCGPHLFNCSSARPHQMAASFPDLRGDMVMAAKVKGPVCAPEKHQGQTEEERDADFP